VAVRPLAAAAAAACSDSGEDGWHRAPLEQQLLSVVAHSFDGAASNDLPDRLDATLAAVQAFAATLDDDEEAVVGAARRLAHAIIAGRLADEAHGVEAAGGRLACALLAALSQAAARAQRERDRHDSLAAAHSELQARFQAQQHEAARRDERVHAACRHRIEQLASRLAQSQVEAAAHSVALALARANQRAAEAEALAASAQLAAAAHLAGSASASGGDGDDVNWRRSGGGGAARQRRERSVRGRRPSCHRRARPAERQPRQRSAGSISHSPPMSRTPTPLRHRGSATGELAASPLPRRAPHAPAADSSRPMAAAPSAAAVRPRRFPPARAEAARASAAAAAPADDGLLRELAAAEDVLGQINGLLAI